MQESRIKNGYNMRPWMSFLCQALALVMYSVWDERWSPLSCLTPVISYLCWPVESTCRSFMTQFNWALKVFISIYHSPIQYLCVQKGMYYYFFKCKHMEENQKGKGHRPTALCTQINFLCDTWWRVWSLVECGKQLQPDQHLLKCRVEHKVYRKAS